MRFMKALVLVCMLGFVAVAVLASNPANAFSLSSLFGKKQAPVSLASIYPIQNDEDFDNTAKSFHGTPYNDPQLEFEIMVPKDWVYEVTPAQYDANGANRTIMGDIARFKSPVINAMRAKVTVQSVKLSREISARNWLENYILSSKYNLQGEITAANEKKATAECIGTDFDGVNSYIYLGAQFNADNAIVVRFDSPLPLKEPLSFVMKKIVDSFRFVLETEQPIEATKSFTFGTSLKFRYPESLVVNHVDVGDSRFMSAQFYNQPKKGILDARGKVVSPIQGLIRFSVVKRSHTTDLKKEMENMKGFVTKTLDLDVKKMVSSGTAPVSKRFIFSRYETYQVVPKKNNPIPQEIRFVALGDKNFYVFGVLFSPSRNEDFFNWAVNTQTFDLMLKEFR